MQRHPTRLFYLLQCVEILFTFLLHKVHSEALEWMLTIIPIHSLTLLINEYVPLSKKMHGSR